MLAGRGITRLMVEGGPTLAAALLNDDLVDAAVLLHSPTDIGPDGIDALEGLPLTALTQSPKLKLIGTELAEPDRIDDVRAHLDVHRDCHRRRRGTRGRTARTGPASSAARSAVAMSRASIADGASIACSGVCMTVVGTGEENGRTWFAVDAAAETLKVTTVGQWRQGTRINLERALRVGDELGGHVVAAHADGIALVTSREDLPDMARFVLRVPSVLRASSPPKGSVALDGVSLTVNEVTADTFSVLIIPHTLAVTTIGAGRSSTRRQSRSRHDGALRGALAGMRARLTPAKGARDSAALGVTACCGRYWGRSSLIVERTAPWTPTKMCLVGRTVGSSTRVPIATWTNVPSRTTE